MSGTAPSSKHHRRYVVTGSTGALGARVVSYLLGHREGSAVVAVTDSPNSVTERANIELVGRGNSSTLEIFSRDAAASGAAFEDGDLVIHTAFPRRGSGAELAQWFDFHRSLCTAAADRRVATFVNVSSQSVYSPDRAEPATETSPVTCYDQYSTSKYAGEIIASDLLPRTALINARLSSLIGPEYPERVFNRFVLQAARGERIVVDGGLQVMDYMDIRDAAAALVGLAESGVHAGQNIINVGSASPLKLMEIAQIVAGMFPAAPTPLINPPEPPATPASSSALSIDLLAKLVDLPPQHTLQSTVRSILAAG